MRSSAPFRSLSVCLDLSRIYPVPLHELMSVAVYFIYPETANVRLEDMNSIFGDATTIAPTPETIAEAESLFSGRSPVPSFRLAGDGERVPSMDLQAPDVEGEENEGVFAKETDSQREGVGGWITNLVRRNRNDDANGSASGRYRRVDQDDQDQQ